MDRQRLGRWGEALARTHLRARGYRILAVRWRAGRLGEIDVVALRGGLLVFVEVRTRRGRSHGTAVESVGPAKRRRLVRLAEAYRAALSDRSPLRSLPCRIDLITVEGEGWLSWRLRHLQGVVEGDGRRFP